MLLARRSSNVRALFASPTRGTIARLQLPCQLRQKHMFPPEELVANNSVAKNLNGLGIWGSEQKKPRGKTSKEKTPIEKTPIEKTPKEKKAKIKGDDRRVNIVDERLCDDIFAYYGDSLRERHQGCDILDFYPGAGVWSRKLNDLLKPRSHILLEPDEALYKPFLAPLLEKPNTTLIPKSGISWEDLHEILSPKYLPHQVVRPRDEEPTRNDTLLVTANFSWFPKRKFKTWASVTQLLLFQFVDAIRSSNLVQKYGLVRMLVWMVDDEKHHLLPHTVQLRRRLAIETELACEWVVEVAGTDEPDRYSRDHYIDLESTQNTIDRMRAQGIVVPPGRERSGLIEALSLPGKVVAGNQPPKLTASTSSELEELREELDKGLILPMTPKRRRLTLLANRDLTAEQFRTTIMEILAEKDAVLKLFNKAKTPAALAAAQRRAAEWNERINSEKGALINALRPCHDNLHIFRQSPPVLHWDRRPVEPLLVKPDEFFPNVPCSLVDIQPKAPHPNIRRTNQKNHRQADIFELILRQFVGYPASPTTQVIEKLHPGARADIVPGCSSFTDPKKGGSPMGGEWGDLNCRCLNQQQLEELITVWVTSPFAPDFGDLLRYTHDLDDNDADYASTVGNVTGKVSIRNLGI